MTLAVTGAVAVAAPAQASTASRAQGYSGEKAHVGFWHLGDVLVACIDALRGDPDQNGQDYGDLHEADSINGLGEADMATLYRLAMDNIKEGTSDEDASQTALAIWKLTGYQGRPEERLTSLQPDPAASLAGADAKIAAAREAAVISVDPTDHLTVTLSQDAKSGTVKSDLVENKVSTGTGTAAAGAYSGTITLDGAVFSDNGTNTHAIINGTDYAITPTQSASGVNVSASVSYTDLTVGRNVMIGEPIGTDQAQRVIAGKKNSVSASASVSVAASSSVPMQLRVDTKVSAEKVKDGEIYFDTYAVSVVKTDENPNGEWAKVDGKPVSVAIDFEAFKDPTGKKPAQQVSVPAGAKSEGTDTVTVTAPGGGRTKDFTAKGTGWRTFVASIDPAKSSAPAKVNTFTSDYGINVESLYVPGQPQIDTTAFFCTTDKGVQGIGDTLHVSGYDSASGTYPVAVTAWQSAKEIAEGTNVSEKTASKITTATVNVTANGDAKTDCLELPSAIRESVAGGTTHMYFTISSPGNGVTPGFTEDKALESEHLNAPKLSTAAAFNATKDGKVCVLDTNHVKGLDTTGGALTLDSTLWAVPREGGKLPTWGGSLPKSAVKVTTVTTTITKDGDTPTTCIDVTEYEKTAGTSQAPVFVFTVATKGNARVPAFAENRMLREEAVWTPVITTKAQTTDSGQGKSATDTIVVSDWNDAVPALDVTSVLHVSDAPFTEGGNALDQAGVKTAGSTVTEVTGNGEFTTSAITNAEGGLHGVFTYEVNGEKSGGLVPSWTDSTVYHEEAVSWPAPATPTQPGPHLASTGFTSGALLPLAGGLVGAGLLAYVAVYISRRRKATAGIEAATAEPAS
ncbi:hypothetical protein [Rathayibacter rathayi]|uniref:hypothetical protein n=1 Tax=Rathayibacter rathayi TaxID=33887 RepID=UPI0011B08774|nr:hypothetical protein [Rathayibacter rathayi]